VLPPAGKDEINSLGQLYAGGKKSQKKQDGGFTFKIIKMVVSTSKKLRWCFICHILIKRRFLILKKFKIGGRDLA